MNRRVNLREILDNPKKKRNLFVRVIQATQAREGIHTTKEQAEHAYDTVQKEKKCRGYFRGCPCVRCRARAKC